MESAERKLARESAAMRALRASLATMTDDPAALRDTLEGEGDDLRGAIEAVLSDIREDEILVLGIAAIEQRLEDRSDAICRRIDRLKAAIEQALLIAEIAEPLRLADATVSLRRFPPSLVVDDEAAIPASFWKPRDPTLDRAALKAALTNGLNVPGVTLDNGGVALVIRRN